MSDMDISQVLSQMRAMRLDATSGLNDNLRVEGNVAGADEFSRLLAESVARVSEAQNQSADASMAFASGSTDVSLPSPCCGRLRARTEVRATLRCPVSGVARTSVRASTFLGRHLHGLKSVLLLRS